MKKNCDVQKDGCLFFFNNGLYFVNGDENKIKKYFPNREIKIDRVNDQYAMDKDDIVEIPLVCFEPTTTDILRRISKELKK